MTYQVKLKSPAEREATIRAAVKASDETRDFYDFRSTKTKLPFVRVSENVLIYRMENFRTYIEQREYVIRGKKPLDFFTTGQENESVQQLQHDILVKLARQGRADSVVPVIDVLRREGQREPLIITHKGVVVNGNRRLAGMRELLFGEEAVPLTNFSHIDCLVLPEDATTAEIVDIEASLQAKPETRLDYDWIGDCLLIQRLLDLGKTIEQVAQKLNRKASEIRNSLNALTEANLYLKDWVGAEGEYGRVVEAEQLFKDLPSELEGKELGLQEASRLIAWNLFENKDKLNERLYAFNLTFGKQAANVLDRTAAELGVPLDVDTVPEDGGFAVDVDIAEGPISYRPLIEAFRDPTRRDEAIETLVDVCRATLETERGKKSGQAALKAITNANARLTEADLARADRGTYGAIEKQLDQITKRVGVLRATLARLGKERRSEDTPTERTNTK